MNTDNSIMLDNATLRCAFTALGCLPFKRESKESIGVFDIHLLGASVLIDSLLLHEHIFVPNIHGEDYPPTLQIASKVLGPELFTVLELHPKEKEALYELAIADFLKWPILSPGIIAYLNQAIGLAPFNVESWDNKIHRRYSSRLISRIFSYDTLSILYTGGEPTIPKQFLDYLQNQRLSSPKTTSFQEIIDTQISREELDNTVLWLTFRTCVYDIISRLRNLTYQPFPTRSELWKIINIRRSSPNLLSNLPAMTLLKPRSDIGKQINDTLGSQEYQLYVPPFLAFVLSLASKPEDIIPITLELRNDRKVKALRECLNVIKSEVKHGSTKQILRFKHDFDKLGKALTGDYYGEKPPAISLSLQIAFIGASYEFPVPTAVNSVINDLQFLQKPHLAFLRDVYKSIVDIWSFSDLYDAVFFQSAKISRSVLRKQLEYPSVEHLKEKAINHIRRKGGCISFVLVDLKDFDSVNLRYGREGGDQVLFLLADIIKKLPSRKIMVSRSAGDTFVILILGSERKEAYDWANTVREELISRSLTLPVKSEAKSIKDTIKVDIHIAIGTANKEDEIDRAFSNALMKLKESK